MIPVEEDFKYLISRNWSNGSDCSNILYSIFSANVKLLVIGSIASLLGMLVIYLINAFWEGATTIFLIFQRLSFLSDT
jgi:hypothetical protein